MIFLQSIDRLKRRKIEIAACPRKTSDKIVGRKIRCGHQLAEREAGFAIAYDASAKSGLRKAGYDVVGEMLAKGGKS